MTKKSANKRLSSKCSPVLRSMSGVFWLMIFLMFVAIFTIIMWVMSPAFDNERRLPVPAWFPVDYHRSDIVYGVLFLYQTIGIVMSATYNFSTDTMFSGLMLHINGQIVRLGSMVKKVSYGDYLPPVRTGSLFPLCYHFISLDMTSLPNANWSQRMRNGKRCESASTITPKCTVRCTLK